MGITEWPVGFRRVPPFFRVDGPLSDLFPRAFQIVVACAIKCHYDGLNEWNRRFATLATSDPASPVVGNAAKEYRAPLWYGEHQVQLVVWLLERLYEVPSGTVVSVRRPEVMVVDYDRRRFEYKGVPVYMTKDMPVAKKGALALPPFEAKLLTALALNAGLPQHEDDLWRTIRRLRGVHSADRPGRIRQHVKALRDVFAEQTGLEDHFENIFQSVEDRVWQLNLEREEVSVVAPRLMPDPESSGSKS